VIASVVSESLTPMANPDLTIEGAIPGAKYNPTVAQCKRKEKCFKEEEPCFGCHWQRIYPDTGSSLSGT